MRKTILIILACLLITVPAFASATFTLSPVSYPVLVDGSQLNSSLPILTYKTNGGDNTYVPMRAVLEMMGAEVKWDGKKADIVLADPGKMANGVVMIYALKNGQRISQGSGVLIDYDEILTAYHVVKSGDAYEIIYNDGSTTTAKLGKSEPSVDTAILEPVRKDVKPVKIGDSDENKSGKLIYAIGYPVQSKKIIKGSVADLGYMSNGVEGFSTNITTNGGFSGGGIFSNTGELVGMVYAGNFKGLGVAVPINDIRKELTN